MLIIIIIIITTTINIILFYIGVQKGDVDGQDRIAVGLNSIMADLTKHFV